MQGCCFLIVVETCLLEAQRVHQAGRLLQITVQIIRSRLTKHVEVFVETVLDLLHFVLELCLAHDKVVLRQLVVKVLRVHFIDLKSEALNLN